MRISDWSSDVCSSDLGIAYWQRDSEHVEKAFDFGGMGARNGVFAALFVAAGASGVPGSLTGDFSYLSAFAEKARPDALVEGLGSRYEILAASIKKRSEEHTSELQSLMRTSYAVFCLKKKKYYTQTS